MHRSVRELHWCAQPTFLQINRLFQRMSQKLSSLSKTGYRWFNSPGWRIKRETEYRSETRNLIYARYFDHGKRDRRCTQHLIPKFRVQGIYLPPFRHHYPGEALWIAHSRDILV